MDVERYPLNVDIYNKTYEFYSEGPKGKIKKVILYKQLKDWNENIFNLGFGDWDEAKQVVDDKVISDNKDHQKVLATVAFTLLDFTIHFPNAIVYTEGVTLSRTRLYQMGISGSWNKIIQVFDVYGFDKIVWEPFRTGRNYEAFLVKRK